MQAYSGGLVVKPPRPRWGPGAERLVRKSFQLFCHLINKGQWSIV